MKVLTIAVEVDTTNPIAIADVCDAIIHEMEELKDHALVKFDDELSLTSNSVVAGPDGELVGDWVIEERRRRIR